MCLSRAPIFPLVQRGVACVLEAQWARAETGRPYARTRGHARAHRHAHTRTHKTTPTTDTHARRAHAREEGTRTHTHTCNKHCPACSKARTTALPPHPRTTRGNARCSTRGDRSTPVACPAPPTKPHAPRSLSSRLWGPIVSNTRHNTSGLPRARVCPARLRTRGGGATPPGIAANPVLGRTAGAAGCA